MTLLDNMPHTVTTSRKYYERDELGGNITKFSTLAADVSAWVQNASMSEIQEFEKRDERVTHKVFFAPDHDLRPGDKISVTVGPSFVDVELHYRASTERSAGMGVLFTAMCEQDNNVQEVFTGS
jgi:hypothetical protein